MKKRTVSLLLLLTAASVVVFGQSQAPTGGVSISFRFSSLARMASNQYAIWIEDENGGFVRTVFVTDFVARRGGWRFRPQALPRWTNAAHVGDVSPSEIDAMSGATPDDGSYRVSWDLRDLRGKVVPSGTYRYLIEANIYWENRVLWSGTLQIGNGPQESHATATFSSPDAEQMGAVISDVAASYMP